MRLFLVLTLATGCTADTLAPDFTVRPGVEIATVLDADPGDALTLYDADGTELITILADHLGQAHFAYVPDAPITLDARESAQFPILDGGVLRPGTYEIRTPDGRTSGPFDVLDVTDTPDPILYERQELVGIHSSPLTGDDGDPEEGFQYIEVRDGTLLSAMVRFPDPLLYGDGPWPTVIEYSGYSPSRPDRPDAGTRIANALGYATVSVNLRGTGCSGGVFDVFNSAQHADGYDIVETVARQDWVLNGHVGMVGLSYPGITQLFVASTNPPHLAAIVPLSTIADPWEMQWPGGIYNEGFTRQWVENREAEAQASGSSWVVQRIEAGDETCAANVTLSSQSIDFESFLHGLEFRPRDADERDLRKLVERIEAPVFLGGAWQDEQTGAQFGAMLDRFHSSRSARFFVSNGRHPDGYGPIAVFDWFEFLEFYVAERIPELNGAIRLVGGDEFAGTFGMEGYDFPDDRFVGFDSVADARAAYEAEPAVRLLFESGAGDDIPGVPVPTFETRLETWPVPHAGRVTWHLAPDGRLADRRPAAPGADAWTFDFEAANETFFGPRGYELLVPLWDIDWTRFPETRHAAYVTDPFDHDVVLAGPGVATLWVNSPVEDATVQTTLTEVRPDGTEVLVQSGWLRLGHRAAAMGPDLRLERSYAQEDFQPLPVGQWVRADVQIPSFAHPVRTGSRLRLVVSSPGRDHGTWEFEPPAYADAPRFLLGRGGDRASRLTLATLPDLDVPPELPPCPSLRGQPCRAYEPVPNLVIE